ncbi:MAG: hypothetical protein ACI9JN_001634 [Bacteroidia bacterium]|jgi:hypothetical protein
MKRFALFFATVIFSTAVYSQTYGNEWINYSQEYFKFKIGSTGLYRIGQQTLINAGIPLASIDPRNIDIFLNGKEIKIYISGESDGSFDPTNYIEFIGRENDGALDQPLYGLPKNHTNPYESLYADSSVYFLTWSNVASSNHLTDYQDPNFVGKTKDDYFMYTATVSFKNDYFNGIPNKNVAQQAYSEYTIGEGFTSARDNTFKQFLIETPSVYSPGPDASLELLGITRNNPAEIFNGYNHGFAIAVGSKSNILNTYYHNGYSAKLFKYSDLQFPNSKMSTTTNVYLGEIDVVNRPLSYYTIPYIKLKYPRTFDLASGSSLEMTSLSSNSYFEFNNYNGSKKNPIIYDYSNENRILGTLNGGTLKFNTKGGLNQQLYISDASDYLSINSLVNVQFKSITEIAPNYIIITNSKLADGAIEYGSYRESIAGGSYKVMYLYSSELYDQFYYGYHHPLAISNGIDYVLNKLRYPVDNILLLGKGQVYHNIRFNKSQRESLDLVPTIGTPPSDYLFVSSLDGSDLNISVPIGRVAARTNDDIRNYLNKVKTHESADYGNWQKKVIQIVGGIDADQNETFNGNVNQYFKIAQDSFLGAHRVKFSKNDAGTTSDAFIEDIQKEINDGANIINYFGHGSAQVLDVDIGDVKDLNNNGKYPLFIFNGCALGNSYVGNSIGEDYLFEPNKGTINWVASTGFGYTSPLLLYTRILHEELLQKNYGESIGKSIKATISRYQNVNDPLNVINCRQLVYQGDPALKLHAPKNSDIIVRNPLVSNKFSAVSDVVIDFDLVNLGKTSADSVTFTVTANNGVTSKLVHTGKLRIPNYIEKSSITIEKSSFLSGVISFQFNIDPLNEIIENAPHGETNNQVVFDHLFELKKPLVIYPLQNAIVNESEVEFLFQISNPDKTLIEIVLEIDTSHKFNSPIFFQKKFSTKMNVVKTTTTLPPTDNYDYFYRIKTVEDTVESEWSVGSFAYLFKHNDGWSESHYDNLLNTNLDLVEFDSLSRKLNYTRKSGNSYKIKTNGRYPVSGANWNYIGISGNFNIVYNYQPNGVHAMAFNPDTEKRLNTPSVYNQKYPPNPYWSQSPPENQKEYYVTGAYTGVYLFQTANKEHRDSFLQFLKSIPDGYHLFMHNNRLTGIEDWEPEIFQELQKFGITGLGIVNESEPFALFGTKGEPNQSSETYADYSDSVTPPINQTIEVVVNIYPRSNSGSIKTEQIGPSSNWDRIKFDLKDKDTDQDSFSISVIGVTPSGSETTLLNYTDSTHFDISSINATQFPYLKLQLNLIDETGFTPMNVERWTVYYDGISEGTINIDVLDELSKDTVERGEIIHFATVFENISKLPFDPTTAQVKLVHQNGTEKVVDTIKMNSIEINQSIELRDTIETFDLAGNYQLFVTANNEHIVLENEYKNNLYYKRFYVATDVRDPIFDVTFDAYHILNNDLVSGNTLISIVAIDENEFLHIDDPALFDIGLKYPGSDSFVALTILDPMFSFNPSSGPKEKAVVNYQTADLPDGDYTLKVKMMDKSGNGSDNPAYTIKFKVESKQTITNIYPYPNPFTTCTKFVFTCTGNEVPDQIKINIYTITGRLVKQIDQFELGPIRIGNNLTDYCWNGTDDYGDKLANGVYLYKAEIRSNGQIIDLSETSSDHLFNNGFGKLYIAR